MRRDLLVALDAPDIGDGTDDALRRLSMAIARAQRTLEELAQLRADTAAASGLRGKELAELLGVSPGTVSGILARARSGTRGRPRW